MSLLISATSDARAPVPFDGCQKEPKASFLGSVRVIRVGLIRILLKQS
ncbi:hypothetical protein VSP9026_04550 [Vibrio spartinae]|uniref:Uncharacterized protein n=1 Tax=Vibrio spartinae TaxID=1918945 RepID=A0A1N6MBL0_9VIBR|nr:hypothetical protein VSP9026_04550 [Vibrio spartinae]